MVCTPRAEARPPPGGEIIEIVVPSDYGEEREECQHEIFSDGRYLQTSTAEGKTDKLY